MRRPVLAVLSALLLISVAAPAQAQFRFRGVEFWGGQYAWSGEQVDELVNGFRGGFGVYGELTPRLGVGVEGVTGGFDSNPNDPNSRLRWDDIGMNGIARLALADRAGFHPFVEARFGWTRISTALPASTEGDVILIRENGLSYGGEVGVEFPLNRRARIIAAGGATRREYGDADLAGTNIPGNSFAGTRWGVRFGIALGRAVD